MNIRFRIVLAGLVSLALTACQHSGTSKQASMSNDVLPMNYVAKAHPLGLGQHPDMRTTGFAYMLLGTSREADSGRAKTACRALFEHGDASRPTVAPNRDFLVTYLPVRKTGDLTRTSGHFKRGVCAHLAEFSDAQREREILQRLDYRETRGPILVAVDSPYRNRAVGQKALVADLSLVPTADLATVIQNWTHELAPRSDLWGAPVDMRELHALMNLGLQDLQVALTKTPQSGDEFSASLSAVKEQEGDSLKL